jgi:hypothetical protein
MPSNLRWSRRRSPSECLSWRSSAAAQRRRYTDRERRTSDHFSSGLFRVLSVYRGVRLLHMAGQAARLGVFGRLDLGRGRRARASSCCNRRGHPGHVGVQFVATRTLEQGRARIGKLSHGRSWGLYVPFNSAAPAALHLHGGSDRLGGLPATRSIFSLTAVARRAAFGGCSRHRCHHARFDLARAHSGAV